MTHKNTRTNNKYINNVNIDNTIITCNNSWCQIVLDLLDLTFAELFYGFMDFCNNCMDCFMDSTK